MGMMAGIVFCFILVIGVSFKIFKLIFFYELFGILRYGIENLWFIRFYGFIIYIVVFYILFYYRG